jgi:hypothetical protein
MAEKEIHIRSKDISLEARLDECPGDGGVVVTHPHPLYGGEMHNNVVAAVVHAYRAQGITTLRFNFRGVGGSEGGYGQGIGEQEDVLAALQFLQARGKANIDLAGYSFGAWVNAMGLSRFQPARRLIMISPPVAFLDFPSFQASSKIRLVIAGSHDDIAPPDVIQELLPAWNPEARCRIVHGADHFYWGMEKTLISLLKSFLEEEPLTGRL